MEIEKKFLVKKLPEDLDKLEKKEIEQAYLCTAPVVRIRKSNERYILTYKSKMKDVNIKARVNQEIEVPLSKEGYLHLRKKADDNIITKTRYLVPLSGGHTGELDIFHNQLDGLFFIEVEFADEEDAMNFVKPDWFGENVSEDERYTNSFLSHCDNLDVFQQNK